jgi:hypothetical protein
LHSMTFVQHPKAICLSLGRDRLDGESSII